MKRSLLLSITLFCLLIQGHCLFAAQADNRFITMNIPEAVISNALTQALPLTLAGTSERLEGTITIVNITNLRLHDNLVFCHIDLRGNNLNLITTVANQGIRLKLGSAQVDFDCETELRYNPGEKTLFIRPIARGIQAEAALKNGDIGQALLIFLNGQEFPIELQDIEPIIAETSNKTVTINTRISDIRSTPGSLQIKIQPIITAVPNSR